MRSPKAVRYVPIPGRSTIGSRPATAPRRVPGSSAGVASARPTPTAPEPPNETRTPDDRQRRVRLPVRPEGQDGPEGTAGQLDTRRHALARPRGARAGRLGPHPRANTLTGRSAWLTSNPDISAGKAETARSEVRLRMKPSGAARGYVDGAWWPRSQDPAMEFPGLVLAMSSWVGP